MPCVVGTVWVDESVSVEIIAVEAKPTGIGIATGGGEIVVTLGDDRDAVFELTELFGVGLVAGEGAAAVVGLVFLERTDKTEYVFAAVGVALRSPERGQSDKCH